MDEELERELKEQGAVDRQSAEVGISASETSVEAAEYRARAEKAEKELEKAKAKAAKKREKTIKQAVKNGIGAAALGAAGGVAGFGGVVANAARGFASSAVGSFFFPSTVFDYFLLISLGVHWFQGEFLGWTINSGFAGILDWSIITHIIMFFAAAFFLFDRNENAAPWIIFPMIFEIAIPIILSNNPAIYVGLHDAPVIKYLLVPQFWPSWAIMAMFAGRKYQPSRFNATALIAFIVMWLIILWPGNFNSFVSANRMDFVSQETIDELDKKKEGTIKATTDMWTYMTAYWNCKIDPEKNCGLYYNLTEPPKSLGPPGTRVDIEPTLVDLFLDSKGGTYTVSYLKKTGLGIDIDIERGTDDPEIKNGNLKCYYHNMSPWNQGGEFIGILDNDATINFESNILAGVKKETRLCKVEEIFNPFFELPEDPPNNKPKRHRFNATFEFENVARSSIKSYFIKSELPEIQTSPGFPYRHRVIPANIIPGQVELDITTKRESPIPIPAGGSNSTHSLPLQLKINNKGEGKIIKINELCLEVPKIRNQQMMDYVSDGETPFNKDCNPEGYCKICIQNDNDNFTNDFLGSISDQLVAQERYYAFYLTLEIGNIGNLFENTNNPVDLIINAKIAYTYQLTDTAYIEVIK